MGALKPMAIRPVSPVSPVSPISPLAPPRSPVAPHSPLTKSAKLLPSPLLAEPDANKYDVKSARGGRGGKVTSVAAIWAAKEQTNGTPPVVPARNPHTETKRWRPSKCSYCHQHKSETNSCAGTCDEARSPLCTKDFCTPSICETSFASRWAASAYYGNSCGCVPISSVLSASFYVIRKPG
jgi:hypothetical protein